MPPKTRHTFLAISAPVGVLFGLNPAVISHSLIELSEQNGYWQPTLSGWTSQRNLRDVVRVSELVLQAISRQHAPRIVWAVATHQG
jgi:hypothetical protein